MSASKRDADGVPFPDDFESATDDGSAKSASSGCRSGHAVEPLKLDDALRDLPRSRFHRGRGMPRGVRWFGASSFWGHLRHFVASAVATEDVDSRDWMTPDEPRELCRRIAHTLERREKGTLASEGATLTDCMARDLWIDYVADTGDDADVSEAVAGLVAGTYVLPQVDAQSCENASLVAPRGDLLFFGGDTAYPVATAEEIHDRVVVPFNRAFVRHYDGRTRVLVGIPGNHDWYDGLDGFARLFRRRPYDDKSTSGGDLHATYHRGELARYTEFAKRFVRGEHVDKPGTLDLVGYCPVQSASYFVLPLAPGLDLYAVDRQLRSVDYRQRQYFESWRLRHPRGRRAFALPDPPYHFGRENASGRRMLEALNLDEANEEALVLSGDIHHYERWREGQTSHVIAGGGGAFLHPAPVSRRQAQREVEWPGPQQSRCLLWQVPWKIAMGRSGILPHFVFAVLLMPMLVAVTKGAPYAVAVGAALAWLVIFVCLLLIGGVRRNRGLLLPTLAAAGASCVVAGPICAQALLESLGGVTGDLMGAVSVQLLLFSIVVVATSIFSSAVFGSYLTLLTWLGLENTQAFTALDHPGYKHFVRMRVRRDGSGIDLWCIGLVDPLAPEERPVLVDAFFWQARR